MTGTIRGYATEWLSDYSLWWSGLPAGRKTLPALVTASYWIALMALGGWRGDHLALGVVALSLAYGGRRFASAFDFFVPLALTAVVYDGQRYVGDYLRSTIHLSEPYLLEKRFFGITTPQGVLTPNEWWQQHVHPALDLLAGFAYLVFFALFVAIAAYFQFVAAGRLPRSVARVKQGPVWAFFWVNMLGYATYYWYPAAPPWYVAAYGFGAPRMDVAASAAGGVRFDQLLGTNLFGALYGRAADVFGAIPSLHVAYPLLAVYFAHRFQTLRAFCWAFYLVMCFSAVYLNHHYVLDVICGSVYALAVGMAVDRYLSRRPA